MEEIRVRWEAGGGMEKGKGGAAAGTGEGADEEGEGREDGEGKKEQEGEEKEVGWAGLEGRVKMIEGMIEKKERESRRRMIRGLEIKGGKGTEEVERVLEKIGVRLEVE